MICAGCYNHSKLINNVYPGAGEDGPKSSALSLLVFYCSSKPQKLHKIGNFLEARVERDLLRYRYGHVRVSLLIINAVLSECKQHASLISKTVLRIVLKVLNSPETDLILLSTNTFILFSSVRNQEDVIDSEFIGIHSKLIRQFCKEASRESNDPLEKNKSRISGLKALESLSEANFFVDGSKVDGAIEPVLNAVLANLNYQTKRDSAVESPPAVYLPRMSIHSGHEKRQSIADNLITDEELRHIAEKCLIGIFRNTNAITLKSLIDTTFRIVDNLDLLDTPKFLLSLIPIILFSVESQYHFVIISFIMDKLDSETRIATKTTLAKVLQYLILTEKLAGLTIPELLDTLITHLKNSIYVEEAEEVLFVNLQNTLTEVIGSLAINLAYPNQVNEIISFLVNRVQFSESPMELTNVQLLFTQSILRGLLEVFEANQSRDSKRSSVIPGKLSYNLITPLTIYFRNPILRFLLYNVLQMVLRSPADDPSRSDLVSNLRVELMTWALDPKNGPADYIMIELGESIPFMFYISKETANNTVSQKRAINSVFVDYVLFASRILKNAELSNYILNIKQTMLDSQQWSPGIELAEEALEMVRANSFSNTETTMDLNPQISSQIDEGQLYVNLTACFPESSGHLLQLEKAWNADFKSRTVRSESSCVSDTSGERRKAARKMPNVKKRSDSLHSADSKRSQKPLSNVNISDFKAALDIESVIIEEKVESIPQVSDLLRSIRDNFGSSNSEGRGTVENVSNTEYDLDWIRTRSQSAGLSQRAPVRSKEIMQTLTKVFEPEINEVNNT